MTAVVEGSSCAIHGGRPVVEAWAMGVPLVTVGVGLLIGFLTPVAGILAGLASAGMAVGVPHGCTPQILDSRPALGFAIIMATVIVALGPGALSIDSVLFGRREIVIPPDPHPPKP